MKSKILALLAVASLLGVGTSHAVRVIDQNNDAAGGAFCEIKRSDNGTLNYCGQSFQQTNTSIAGAGIFIDPTSTGTGTITFSIYSKYQGGLSGLIATGTSGDVNRASGWVDVFWAPVAITPSTTYYLVLSSGSSGLLVSQDSSGSGGGLYSSGNALANLKASDYAKYDLMFRTYYDRTAGVRVAEAAKAISAPLPVSGGQRSWQGAAPAPAAASTQAAQNIALLQQIIKACQREVDAAVLAANQAGPQFSSEPLNPPLYITNNVLVDYQRVSFPLPESARLRLQQRISASENRTAAYAAHGGVSEAWVALRRLDLCSMRFLLTYSGAPELAQPPRPPAPQPAPTAHSAAPPAPPQSVMIGRTKMVLPEVVVANRLGTGCVTPELRKARVRQDPGEVYWGEGEWALVNSCPKEQVVWIETRNLLLVWPMVWNSGLWADGSSVREPSPFPNALSSSPNYLIPANGQLTHIDRTINLLPEGQQRVEVTTASCNASSDKGKKQVLFRAASSLFGDQRVACLPTIIPR